MTDWKKEMEEFNAHFNTEMAKSEALPEGVQVGKLFRTNVADGYAWYEVTRINKKTIRVKCRTDLCPDKYQDQVLGQGGSFPYHIIENLICRLETLNRIFSKRR